MLPGRVLALLLLSTAGALLAQDRNSPRGRAGEFDYYVLSLSWSPEYCAGPNGGRDPGQCGEHRQFGFITHGLWPQYQRGGWPQFCSTERMDGRLMDALLPLMPSPRLIRHEWSKHGTCSGFDSAGYFRQVRKAYESVRIPPPYQEPRDAIRQTSAELRASFRAANPGLPGNGFAVYCSGRFLSEVRICLDKDLKPRPCGSGIRDGCRAPELIVRPLR